MLLGLVREASLEEGLAAQHMQAQWLTDVPLMKTTSEALKPVRMLPDVTKGTLQILLRISSWEDYPRLSQQVSCNHKDDRRHRIRGDGDDRSRGQRDTITCFEVGKGPGSKEQEASHSSKLGKARKQVFPSRLQKEHSPADTLIFFFFCSETHFRLLISRTVR